MQTWLYFFLLHVGCTKRLNKVKKSPSQAFLVYPPLNSAKMYICQASNTNIQNKKVLHELKYERICISTFRQTVLPVSTLQMSENFNMLI